MNTEWIAFADKERDPTILAEESRLRLDDAQLMQLPQWLRVAHEDIRIEAGGAAHIQRQVAQGHSTRAYHLNKDGLRQGDQEDVG